MRHFRVRHIFSSILISYVLVLLVPLILAGSLSLYLRQVIRTRCVMDFQTSLTQERITFERKIESMREDAMRLYNNRMLTYLEARELFADGDPAVYSVYDFHRTLNNYYGYSQLYEDYALVLSKGTVFRSSGVVSDHALFYSSFRQYEELPFEQWEGLFVSETTPYFIPAQNVIINGVQGQYLTYCYPYLATRNRVTSVSSCLQMLIPYDSVLECFASDLASDKVSLFILDARGTCIVRGGAGTSEDLEKINFYGSDDSFKAELSSGKCLISRQISEISGLTYVTAVPLSAAMEVANRFTWAAIFLMWACIGLELFLGIWFARQYTAPLKNIIGNIQNFMAGNNVGEVQEETERTEYEYLEQSINDLMDSNSLLQKSLVGSRLRSRTNYLTLLFHGAFSDEKHAREEAMHVGLKLKAERYAVLVLRTLQWNEDAVRLLESETLPGVIACSFLNSGNAALLLGVQGENGETEAAKAARKIADLLDDSQEGEVYAGLGNLYRNPAELGWSFEQAANAALQAEAKRQTLVINAASTAFLQLPWYPADFSSRLNSAIRNGEREQVSACFEELYRENAKTRHLSADMQKILIYQTAQTLMALCEDEMETETAAFVSRIPLESGSLADKLSELQSAANGLVDLAEKRRHEQNEVYREQIERCLEENYQDSSFGIATLADTFSLSEKYFSRFFKTVMGESFSTCLEKLRLSHAVELLQEGKGTVEEIASLTGYASAASFRRAFKRVYGVSPTAYNE